MVRRDLFKKQSDTLAKGLHKLLDGLKKEKDPLTAEEAWAQTRTLLQLEKNVSLEESLHLPSEQALLLLLDKTLDLDHLDLLADTLQTLADRVENTLGEMKKEHVYAFCLALYRYVEQHDTAYSLQRHYKIQRLVTLI